MGRDRQGQNPAAQQTKNINNAHSSAQSPNNQSYQQKRTIMSGIVRRQPLHDARNGANPTATGVASGQFLENADTVATIVSSPTNNSNLNLSGQSGGNLANALNQSGILSANKISFYPTNPHRTSNNASNQHSGYYSGNKPSQQFNLQQSRAGHSHRQVTTSHGRRLTSNHHNSGRGSQHPSNANRQAVGGNTLQNKWSRLIQDQSSINKHQIQKPEINNTQIVDAINIAFSGLQSPKNQSGANGQKMHSQQRPGTQGGMPNHHTNVSPTSMGSNANQAENYANGQGNFFGVSSQNTDDRAKGMDVAMRVKKYKQTQMYQQNMDTSHIVMPQSQTRNKTSSQRGLSDLLRNQNTNPSSKKASGGNQYGGSNKFSRQQQSSAVGNATLENRSPSGGHVAGGQGLTTVYIQNDNQRGTGGSGNAALLQTQKLQNNFFFQPSSPRDSVENLNMTQDLNSSNPGYQQQQRNIRTAAGGPRQRVGQSRGGGGNLQIQTNNQKNLNMTMRAPYNGNYVDQHAKTTQNANHALGKSFDFNKYHNAKNSGANPQLVPQPHKQMMTGASSQAQQHLLNKTNVIPAHQGTTNFHSPQSHPESAFFKPKIGQPANLHSERAALHTSGGTRTSGRQSQKPSGTFSPKNPANKMTDQIQVWAGKKGSPPSENQKTDPGPETKEKKPDPKSSSQQQADEIVFSDKHSLNEYIIGKQIGQGAYATVRIGMHKKLNKKVALKIYEKEKIKDIQRKKAVRREIRLMKRLNHPNIAILYEAIETDDQVILVLEYVPGGSTHGFLKSKPNRRMAEDDARRIYRQLISALQYLHGKCIAHRDIKLENVMLDERNLVKLIDFGFSTCIPNEQKIKIFCGTPSYMAPEIVKKTEFCGPPTDIYASGVLLFAFFCGQFPYRGQNDKELYSKIMNGDLKIPEHVPFGPRNIIMRCMQVNADDRPTSAELWTDPWLQNFNPTSDQSLVSYSSRHSYSTRGANYVSAASARYAKGTQNPFYSPNNRAGQGSNRTETFSGFGTQQQTQTQATANHTRGSNDSRGQSWKNNQNQTINNNINIINNITQITYHTNGSGGAQGGGLSNHGTQGGPTMSGTGAASPGPTSTTAGAIEFQPASNSRKGAQSNVAYGAGGSGSAGGIGYPNYNDPNSSRNNIIVTSGGAALGTNGQQNFTGTSDNVRASKNNIQQEMQRQLSGDKKKPRNSKNVQRSSTKGATTEDHK